ncbi:MAG TPA: ATP synthase F1 subunit delta [Candidatus Tyrphobacter sp.]
MMNQTLARRYATAVYSLATEAGAVERIGKDLERIVASIDATTETKRFFVAPIINRYEKERALTKAFEGRVADVALHALLLLVRKHREALLYALLDEYRTLEMRGRGVDPLVVTSARPLSSEELASVTARVERIYGRHFETRLLVDPRLVGGMRITMGDRRIDGTIAGRLQELARILTAI